MKVSSRIVLGKTPVSMDSKAFGNCTGCHLIRFRSPAVPEIAADAFYNVTADAFYPPVSQWSEEVRQNYGGTLTWSPCCPDTHPLESVAAVPPTCTEPGKEACWYCPACGRYFEDAEGTTEILDVETWGIIGPAGHDWGETVYEWAPDGSACTAVRICKNDPAHQKTAEAVITSEISAPADCVNRGRTLYTASFSEDWTKPQTMELENIEALGNIWEAPACEWDETGRACTASRICTRDPSHKEVLEALVTSRQTVATQVGIPGELTFTASFSEDWAQDQTRTEEVPALEIDAAHVFTDIHRDDWYYDAVNFAFRAGLFNGMTATTCAPETSMSRAMLVTVLWRQEGEPEGPASPFRDVPQGHTTRAQMTILLMRFLHTFT